MPTAEDMAEYILSTGDQQTVAQLIEAMVEGGEVSYTGNIYWHKALIKIMKGFFPNDKETLQRYLAILNNEIKTSFTQTRILNLQ